MQILCRVLSVKTSVDRRAKIAAQLDASKIPEWSFFDALDKDNLDINFDYDAFKNEFPQDGQEFPSMRSIPQSAHQLGSRIP
jgi:hypothetical protein